MEKKNILLTFDVEDWFQVENFKEYIDFSTWNSFSLRVEKNTMNILDFLDGFSAKPKATFFILGWIARKLPQLVVEIHKRGHEIASHGCDHHLCTALDERALLSDLRDSRSILEDITGQRVDGYRAPSFAVNDRIMHLIEKAGYTYDSSYNSFSAHGRYGTINLSGSRVKNGVYRIGSYFYELPVSNINLFGKIFPLGGGGYFRLFPFPLFKQGVKTVLNHQNMFLFYSHPWEFDPSQPRVNQASKSFKFRHYVNIHKTMTKLTKLLEAFNDNEFISCASYIKSVYGQNYTQTSEQSG